jgi:hypothetical protein
MKKAAGPAGQAWLVSQGDGNTVARGLSETA